VNDQREIGKRERSNRARGRDIERDEDSERFAPLCSTAAREAAASQNTHDNTAYEVSK
jgi:hypothetical protein